MDENGSKLNVWITLILWAVSFQTFGRLYEETFSLLPKWDRRKTPWPSSSLALCCYDYSISAVVCTVRWESSVSGIIPSLGPTWEGANQVFEKCFTQLLVASFFGCVTSSSPNQILLQPSRKRSSVSRDDLSFIWLSLTCEQSFMQWCFTLFLVVLLF